MEVAQIEPTTRCNFTCGFCCGRHMRQADLPFEVFEKILALYPRLTHVELQGEGEPLMHPRFFDMVDVCRAKNIRVSMVTNGSYFSPENVERILRGGIEKIFVSIESPVAETFREIRGGKLEKVLRGLELLLTQRRARGLDKPVVGFALSVLKKTVDALPAVLALYEKMGMDGGINVQLLQRMESYSIYYDEQMKAQLLTDEDGAAYMKRLATSKQYLAITSARLKGPRGFYDDLFWGWTPQTRSCPWLEKGGYISLDGDVTGCCMIKAKEFAFGNVMTDDADRIAASRDKMRAELKSGVTPAPCRGCPVIEKIDRVHNAQFKTKRRLDVV